MKIGSIILILFSVNSFAEIYLDCKNPEKLGYKKDFYLLKILDEFERCKTCSESEGIGQVEITGIVQTKSGEIGIVDYGSLEIFKQTNVYSMSSEKRLSMFKDYWQIFRKNLKLEVTRSRPYQEFNGKCKIIDEKKHASILQKYSDNQKKWEKRKGDKNKI